VLQHRGGSTQVEPCIPMSEVQVVRLAAARALCEACRTVRPRTQTFIVRERATGRTIQLGSSCLRPLTGSESAEEAIRRAQTVARIRTVLVGAARQPPDPGEQYIDTSMFLAHAVSVVRSGGFHRSDEEKATWQAALSRLEQGVEPTAEDLTRAGEIRDWASQLRPRDADGYRGKLAACLPRERLTSRELPLAASAVRAYNRHLYWRIRRERASDARRK
jgi:threonine dehydrogenase-like Zn-dependent dehydrogenase